MLASTCQQQAWMTDLCWCSSVRLWLQANIGRYRQKSLLHPFWRCLPKSCPKYRSNQYFDVQENSQYSDIAIAAFFLILIWLFSENQPLAWLITCLPWCPSIFVLQHRAGCPLALSKAAECCAIFLDKVYGASTCDWQIFVLLLSCLSIKGRLAIQSCVDVSYMVIHLRLSRQPETPARLLRLHALMILTE